ncbi:MAG TPA: trypsin-like peptidase domain-containing protein [Rubrobacteraceae bacterium]|nr:trypsin-like peptidase domain-containing protein [Rubrobacteraceae bacterium]
MKKWPRAYSLLFALTLAAVLLTACSDDEGSGDGEKNQAPAQAAAQAPDDEPVAQVAAEVSPSVVQVNVQAIQTTPFGTQEQEGVGSGVIYREDGYIVTNHHVVEGASEVNVAFADGTTERAEVVGSDPRSEIAVVRVDRDDLPAAAFSDDQDLVVGQLAVAIGSPAGFESTVTAGVVSAIGREFPPELTGGDPEAAAALADLVQTDAAISPGSSGGALADRDGEIIGINVAYLPPQQTRAVNIGFAIPSDTAMSVADQLIETGEVSSAYLGVVTTDLSTEEAERFDLPVQAGALVSEVESGSAADEAGVRSGDVIVALGDAPIESTGDLLGALRDYQPGDSAELTIVRDGEEQTVDVTLDERPAQ